MSRILESMPTKSSERHPRAGSGRSVGAIVRAAALGMLLQTIGLAAGVAITLGAARVTAAPRVYLTAGGLGYLAGVTGPALLYLRGFEPAGRRWRKNLLGGMTAVALIAIGVAVLIPTDEHSTQPESVENVGYWRLGDGSRIAYSHIGPSGPSEPLPVVFVHGGPGVPDMAGDSAFFGRLADDGYDVYVYDRVGTGRSSRLDNPAGYTLDRWVENLELIRRDLDASQMILIGHSYGAGIAARYMERHPGRVSRLVLSSPGPIPGSSDRSDSGLVGRLQSEDRLRVYRLLLSPRTLLSYGLLQVNPAASKGFTGDGEMDARFDRVYNATRDAMVCPGGDTARELHGLGFYAHYHPQSVRAPAIPDIREGLAGSEIPTLIVKGSCDYLSWQSAIEYMDVLPSSHLLYLPDAGHYPYHDRPQAYLTGLRAFLRGDQVPKERFNLDRPEDYQGP